MDPNAFLSESEREKLEQVIFGGKPQRNQLSNAHSITFLNLSAKVSNALMRCNILTIGTLGTVPREMLQNMKNIGEKSAEMIDSCLTHYGFHPLVEKQYDLLHPSDFLLPEDICLLADIALGRESCFNPSVALQNLQFFTGGGEKGPLQLNEVGTKVLCRAFKLGLLIHQ